MILVLLVPPPATSVNPARAGMIPMRICAPTPETVNPARAGMIRQCLGPLRDFPSKPRASGDDPNPYQNPPSDWM